MRVSDILTAAFVAPLVAAHGGIPGAPKIFGMAPYDIAALKSRNILGGQAARPARAVHGSALQVRQDGRCGKDFGCAVCPEGSCCSGSGYCGQGQDYCQAPDSNFEYGPGADANKLPAGGTTRNIARPKVGNVLYGGEGIYVCTKPGQIAITYDDGPYVYTNDLLDMFKSYNFKATFFMTGINLYKGSIDDESTAWPAVIRRMAAEGHQLASHTWSHQDLSAITKAQRYEQMVRLEMAMSNIVGKFPTYMRPPYSSCSAASGCQQDMSDLGYHISYFDLDTDDYNQITADKAQIPKDNVKAALDKANSVTDEFLAIAHDIHFQTVHNLTGYMLDLMVKKGYKGVTMGECLGDAEANWYRSPTGRVATSSVFTQPACASTRASSSLASASVSASRTSSGVAATPTGVSLDSSCGPTVGLTCLGFSQGECCSQYGYCGSTEGHCGEGCQKGFGKCGTSSSSASASQSGVTSSSRAASSSVRPSSVASESSTRASSSSAPSSTPNGITSPDSSCGGTKGYTCVGFAEGECCSQYGYCGNTAGHCGTGCNPLFGKCTSSGASSSARPASSALPSSSNRPAASVAPSSSRPASSSVAPSSRAPSSAPASSSPRPSSTRASSSSTRASSSSTRALSSSIRASSSAAPQPTGSKTPNGTCGSSRGYHCLGFMFGECCSQFGFCGSTSLHCGSKCQSAYGKCN